MVLESLGLEVVARLLALLVWPFVLRLQRCRNGSLVPWAYRRSTSAKGRSR